MIKFVSPKPLNPFSTAAPIWGQTSQIPSDLSPKRDWGSKRVNTAVPFWRQPTLTLGGLPSKLDRSPKSPLTRCTITGGHIEYLV